MNSRRDFLRNLLAGGVGVAVVPGWVLADVHRYVPAPVHSPSHSGDLSVVIMYRDRYGDHLSQHFVSPATAGPVRVVIPDDWTAIEQVVATLSPDVMAGQQLVVTRADETIFRMAVPPGGGFLTSCGARPIQFKHVLHR